ncbi:MAG: adenylate/guanylate cyclase domain-containing protein [Spirochaetia bacterium]|nr:adenylate/guanylate cyclase domain-containing protein [Spirochaetia bacterium]
MLQLLWNQLAYLGVAATRDAHEQKHIVLVNSLCIVISLFTLANIPFSLMIGVPMHFQIASLVYALLLFFCMYLNAAGATRGARLGFAFSSFLYLAANSVITGVQSHFYLFFLTEIMVLFFIFPAHERPWMYGSALLVTAAYSVFQAAPQLFPGFIAASPEFIAQQRLTIDISVGFLVFAFSFYIYKTFHTSERYLKAEQEKSEKLLLNILPSSIVKKLRESPDTIADRFENCTVLFSDIVGFTGLSKKMPAVEVVSLLNEIFSSFDDLAEKHGLEKIKTIGDAYMVVGGLPEPDPFHAEKIASFALEMLDVIREYREKNDLPLELRVGINTGAAVAGVIGKKKFIYDLWGDSVNTASRMESHGLPGQIQVTETTYELLKGKFRLEERGIIDVKGLGTIKSFLLLEGPA